MAKTKATDRDRREALQEGLLAALHYVDGISRVTRDCLGVAEDRDARILLLAIEEPGIAPGVMADRVGAAPSVISRTLGRLEGKDLLVRRANGSDARGRGVWATRHGKARVRALGRNLDEYFREQEQLGKDTVARLRPRAKSAAGRSGGAELTALEVAERFVGLGAAIEEGAERSIIAYEIENPADRLALVTIDSVGATRPNYLADALHLTTGGVTLMLDRMERRDLVRRRHDAVTTDRRAVLVAVAPRGKRAVTALVNSFEAVVDEACDAMNLAQGR